MYSTDPTTTSQTATNAAMEPATDTTGTTNATTCDATTMPATRTADDPYTPSYSMPPSPTAEPFIPATTIPTTTDTPRDRAYALHLQGYRSPAIAAHLHVPERTIRHWIQTTNQEINALPALDDALEPTDPDQQATTSTDRNQSTASTLTPLTTLQHQRTLAIERHRARSAAAWALLDQLRATLDPFLARLSERLLLHTQYPDDADHVSMSTLELAGGPLSPAFRAMYQMLPGLVNGLTRTLALAERADLQIDRLLALPPTPACLQPQPTATTPASAPKPPTPAEPLPPLPTSEDFRRAAEAARIAAEDAYIIPRLTKRQRDLIRAYCALPDPLPDGDDDDAWTVKLDPNAPLDRWREVLLPHTRHLDDDLDDLDDLDLAPPSGTNGTPSGKPSGKKIGNPPGNTSGNPSGKGGAPTGKRSASPRPQHRPTNRPTAAANGGGKDHHARTRTDARTDAPTAPGNKIGNNSGKPTGNATAHRSSPTSPHAPFP